MDTSLIKSFLQAINTLGNFSPSDISLLTEKLKRREVSKNEVLLRMGEVSQSIYFVENGAFRQYHFKDEIEEVTVGLFCDSDWMVDLSSFTSQKPSKNAIVAFSEGVIVELNIHFIHELIGSSPSFFRLGKILDSCSRAAELVDAQSAPGDRYEYLIRNKPSIVRQFPLKYIASYLNMTPETLSRVRRKIAQPDSLS